MVTLVHALGCYFWLLGCLEILIIYWMVLGIFQTLHKTSIKPYLFLPVSLTVMLSLYFCVLSNSREGVYYTFFLFCCENSFKESKVFFSRWFFLLNASLDSFTTQIFECIKFDFATFILTMCSCGHTPIICYNYGHFRRKPSISTTDSILEKLTKADLWNINLCWCTVWIITCISNNQDKLCH